MRRGKTIIPGRQAMSDTHGELYFARYDARNRLVTGGAVIGPGNKVERIKQRVGERLRRLWPQIGSVEFDYVWNGYVGMTTDFLPRIHRLGPDAYGWTGCNGRAVALSMRSATNCRQGGARRSRHRIGAAVHRSGADRRARIAAPARALDADGLPAARCAGNGVIANRGAAIRKKILPEIETRASAMQWMRPFSGSHSLRQD